ncbi:MAG: PaaI family thioesterase [Thermodesulfobacteriota bacterium]
MEIGRDFLDRFNGNDLYRTLGIRIEEAAGGRALSRLEPEPAVCWPFPTQPHGGVLFTQMDTTMAWAVLTRLEPGRNCTTVDLNIQYTAPAKGTCFLCAAQVAHTTGRLAFVRAETTDAEGRLLAVGQGTFRITNTDPFSG